MSRRSTPFRSSALGGGTGAKRVFLLIVVIASGRARSMISPYGDHVGEIVVARLRAAMTDRDLVVAHLGTKRWRPPRGIPRAAIRITLRPRLAGRFPRREKAAGSAGGGYLSRTPLPTLAHARQLAVPPNRERGVQARPQNENWRGPRIDIAK